MVETQNHVMKVQNFDKLDYLSLKMGILLYNICFEFINFLTNSAGNAWDLCFA